MRVHRVRNETRSQRARQERILEPQRLEERAQRRVSAMRLQEGTSCLSQFHTNSDLR